MLMLCEEAFPLLLETANSGDAKSQYLLGIMYKKGRKVPKDYCKALEWYQKAAEQGYDLAQYALGKMYEDGHGVPKDCSKALEWFQKAAEQGHEDAQMRVAPTPFPPPPVPGNVTIQPLTNDSMLREEGRIMHHCVGKYGGAVRKGECFIYRILMPVRATLEIRPCTSRQIWEVSQIKSYCNATPAPEVFEMVRGWLKQYNQTS